MSVSHDQLAHPQAEPRLIRFYDTTLRDGEQMPGVAFQREHQVMICRALEALGLDEIEIGFAASGPEQRADMAHVCSLGLRPRLLSLCRPVRDDIDAARAVGVGGVILFTSVSDILLQHKLRKGFAEVLEQACQAVGYARSLGLFAQMSLEDATRTETARLQEVARRAAAAGAQRISLADTVGISTPQRMARLVEAMRAAVDLPIAVHCHNDFGLAVANSLAAVDAGAEVLSTTMNGIGERSGNASTEECALALEHLHGYRTSLDFSRITRTSRLVAECARVPIPPNKAIVGRNSFRHESGIHVAATLRDPRCYEPFDPALVGATRELVLGKTSGRAALRNFTDELGVELDDEMCRRVLDKIKERAENGEQVTAGVLKELLASCRY